MGDEEVQHCAMQKALQNPIILQQIFQNGSAPGKAIRLVCHQWNEILLSLPLPKLTLRLYPDPKSSPKFCTQEFYFDCCNSTQFLLFCRKMEPRLARRIEQHGCILKGDYLEHPRHQRISAAEAKLLQISDKFSLLLEDLTINFADAAVIPTVHEILKNFCPNLKRLRIHQAKEERDVNNFNFEEDEDDEDDFDVPGAPLELIRDKLTFIEIEDLTKHSRFFDMTQLILKSAPNLTHLKYQGKLYPDLGGNGSIKRIDLEVKPTTNVAGHVYGINRMLGKVKDHLEVLHVQSKRPEYEDEDEADDEEDDDFPQIPIPEMKNLKVFENQMVDLFTCGDQLEEICTARSPTLQTLQISAITGNLDALFRNVIQEKDSFSRVKQLHVKDVNDPELVAGLNTPFPNLASLTILESDEHGATLTEPYLKACASLKLKKLRIELPNKYSNLSEFVQSFPNCNELMSQYPGLKTVTLKLRRGINDDLDLIEDGVAKMKRCLLDMKGLGNVYLPKFWFKEETRNWMEPFIQENEIPIVFHLSRY